MHWKPPKPKGTKLPAATVAFYGPDDQTATKVVVGIIEHPDGELAHLHRWYSSVMDVRTDRELQREIAAFIQTHQVKTVMTVDGIIGCPHEEGRDYPEGGVCPHCPFWAGRDPWADEPPR